MFRSYLVTFSLFVFSLVLVGKLIHLQFFKGEKYRELALKRTLKNDILQPSRGNIYADDGSIMATSVARYEIRWDAAVPSKKTYQSKKNELAKGLSMIINIDKHDILKKLDNAVNRKNRYLLIAKGLSYSQQKRVKMLAI